MGNYPHKASDVKDPFKQTYGTATDSYSMWYTHQGGEEVTLQKGSVQICKIYSMNHEFFCFNESGQKVMLSENGKMKPNAKNIVHAAKGYGNPMVWVCGSLSDPTYMSAITNPTTATWELVSYKSWRGLQKGLTSFRDPMQQDTYHRQHLGSMSINVLNEPSNRATTMRLDGRKITEWVDKTFQGTVSSVLEMALDAITCGTASPLMEATGLSAAIDQLGVDAYEKSFGAGHQTAGSIFTNWAKHSGIDTGFKIQEDTQNKITDERLPIAIDKMLKLGKVYGVDKKHELMGFDYTRFTPREKAEYLRTITHLVTVGAVDKQMKEFKQSLKITKEMVPTLDLKIFDLGGRLSPEQRLIQLSRYKKTFKTSVMPALTKLYEDRQISKSRDAQAERARQSLKVQPENTESTGPKPSMQEETTEHKKEKTDVNKKMSNKIVLGGTKKNAWHVNLTVKG